EVALVAGSLQQRGSLLEAQAGICEIARAQPDVAQVVERQRARVPVAARAVDRERLLGARPPGLVVAGEERRHGDPAQRPRHPSFVARPPRELEAPLEQRARRLVVALEEREARGP